MMLAGKAIVITGSGRGIGAACARGAAVRGASVVVNDVDADATEETVAAIREAGGAAIACPADVSDWGEAGRLVAACIEAFGRIDGLVNNAVLFHVAGVEAIDPIVARAMTEVNILGPIHCIGHAVKPMLAQGSGSIVNVVSGAHMGMRGMGLYGATKGAVASMVYTWAIELAGTGVRINGLSPFGSTNILANSNRRLNRRYGTALPEDPPSRRTVAIQPPEANSPVVEYLLSDAAAQVNGQLVRMDKGELQLYTHPALLLPSVTRESWTAEQVADAFATTFADRQIECGVWGMESLPVALTSGHWSRAAATAS
jgi:NAD(P)-dependent dehydrogenase (short-subunit alcohol dehydrogenase family)